jgi:hypothetical protein
VASARKVKTKKRCCKSGPRCQRCPAAMKRLQRKGLARRTGKRTYVISLKASKRDIKAARNR